MSLRVSVSGVRGIVGVDLDAVVAARWASAFGAWLPPGPVVVGRDTRPSGPMVLAAVTAGLTSTGHEVRDIGVATTPTTELETAGTDAVGGVIITASHNPQPWNALKFLRGDGLFLTAAQNAELRCRYDEGGGHVAAEHLGSTTSVEGAGRRHLESVLALPWLDAAAIRRRRLTAVVDAVEGAGGEVLPDLLDALGVRCERLHCGLSGHFPHDPEPTPAHLEELCAEVRRTGADLGLAVDPDVDRLALVDGGGRALSEELTLVLACDVLLARESGPVAVNLSTTGLMEQVGARHGVEVLRTPVGEANVVEVMLAANCVVGGEGNGGVIYPGLHAGRDALVGAALILQGLAESGRTLAQLADAWPPVVMVKEKVAAEGLPAPDVLAACLQGLGRGLMDARDGLKWVGPGAWIHVRASNTESVVRIIAEAATEPAARALIDRVRPIL
ncbi:MAG: phosphoglucosamine mutase [Candidatus Krumholzibacteriia bacterium]